MAMEAPDLATKFTIVRATVVVYFSSEVNRKCLETKLNRFRLLHFVDRDKIAQNGA